MSARGAQQGANTLRALLNHLALLALLNLEPTPHPPFTGGDWQATNETNSKFQNNPRLATKALYFRVGGGKEVL